jgi:hypothetical protein
MAALGRFDPFNRGRPDDGSSWQPSVRSRSRNARPCLQTPSHGANRQFNRFTASAPASRLMASWMGTSVTKEARVWAGFSKSLARRQFRSGQEKVRSTSHRRVGRRNRSCPSLLISPCARDRHLGHGSFNLTSVVAAIGPDQFKPEKHGRTKAAPPRSQMAAQWTTTRIGSTSVSTRAWIMRPFTFVPAS